MKRGRLEILHAFNRKSKRGLSGVVTAVLLIALVMVAGLVIWAVVSNMVDDSLDQAAACFGNFEKITLNGYYTCYNSSGSEVQFSISIGDVQVDSIIVYIGYEAQTESTEIFSGRNSSILDIRPYLGEGGDNVTLPDMNGGQTYAYMGIDSKPDFIKIAPKIKGNQCEISDQINNIDDCSLFVFD